MKEIDSSEREEIIELLKNIISVKRISEITGKSVSVIRKIAFINDIGTDRNIRKAILDDIIKEISEDESNKRIADEFNVYENAVQKVRKEIEAEQNKKSEIDPTIEELMKHFYSPIQISQISKASRTYVNNFLSAEYNSKRKQIVQEIRSRAMSFEEIVDEFGIDEEDLKRIVMEEEERVRKIEEERRKQQEIEQERKRKEEEAKKKEAERREEKIINSNIKGDTSKGSIIKPDETFFEVWAKYSQENRTTNLSDEEKKAMEYLSRKGFSVEYIKYKTGVPIEQVRDMKRQKAFEQKRGTLIQKLKELKARNTHDVENIENSIKYILENYPDILTPADYSLLIYAYMRIADNDEALRLGRKGLGIEYAEGSTFLDKINQLYDKIKEIVNKELEKQLEMKEEKSKKASEKKLGDSKKEPEER